MTVRWEWQRTRGGKRYRRIVEPDAPAKKAAVVVEPEAVAEAEAVPELVIETDEAPKPKRGRPKKVVTDE